MGCSHGCSIPAIWRPTSPRDAEFRLASRIGTRHRAWCLAPSTGCHDWCSSAVSNAVQLSRDVAHASGMVSAMAMRLSATSPAMIHRRPLRRLLPDPAFIHARNASPPPDHASVRPAGRMRPSGLPMFGRSHATIIGMPPTYSGSAAPLACTTGCRRVHGDGHHRHPALVSGTGAHRGRDRDRAWSATAPPTRPHAAWRMARPDPRQSDHPSGAQCSPHQGAGIVAAAPIRRRAGHEHRMDGIWMYQADMPA